MQRFASLCLKLAHVDDAQSCIKTLTAYLQTAPEQDRLWAIYLLCHPSPKRTVATKVLRAWVTECTGVPQWLFENSKQVVGDQLQTISLLMPPPHAPLDHPLVHWMEFLSDLRNQDEPTQKKNVLCALTGLSPEPRLILLKLMTATFHFRVPVTLMARALVPLTGQPETGLTYRLTRNWSPGAISFHRLFLLDDPQAQLARPYPFQHSAQYPGQSMDLGDPSEWLIEHLWAGLKVQMVRRDRQLFIWSDTKDMVSDSFPEFIPMLDYLPDGTVIEGTIQAARDGIPLPGAALRVRLERKVLSRKALTETPVRFLASDLLEAEGNDQRHLPLLARRAALHRLIDDIPIAAHTTLSGALEIAAWADLEAPRANARKLGAAGVSLKRLSRPYTAEPQNNASLHWKTDPLSMDGVLIYSRTDAEEDSAMPELTFGVWKEGELVPFAKVIADPKHEETARLSKWIGKNLGERFGPVRRVSPTQVFRISFEAIQQNKRRNSGVVVQAPYIKRWLHGTTPEAANSVSDLQALLRLYSDDRTRPV